MPLPRIQGILDDPITRHMRTDFARLHVNQTVGEALSTIRANPPGSRVIYFYVVDDAGKLRGVVPTRRLLLNPPDKRVDEIMVQRGRGPAEDRVRAGRLRVLHFAPLAGVAGGR